MDYTISSLLSYLKSQLKPFSPDLYKREAEQILQYVLNSNRNSLHLNSHKKVSEDNKLKCNEILKQRLSGKPLQYAIGEEYFYSSNFKIDENVLIPRPDTETLIEVVLRNESDEHKFFADIGTGSGIITQTLLLERNKYKGLAIDISLPALYTASKNINQRGTLLCSDKLSSIKESAIFDFIVSNPPYITTNEMAELEDSVLNYEPHKALWGGDDGLDFYRYFSKNLKKYLKTDGHIYLEIGHLQKMDIFSLLELDRWKDIEICKDLANRDRVIKARKNNE